MTTTYDVSPEQAEYREEFLGMFGADREQAPRRTHGRRKVIKMVKADAGEFAKLGFGVRRLRAADAYKLAA